MNTRFVQQLSNDNKRIVGFPRVDIGKFPRLYKTTDQIKVWLGARAIFCAKIAACELILTQSPTIFRTELRRIIAENRQHIQDTNPFFGLEASRFINSTGLEEEFAECCVRKILQKSEKIAESWLSNAHMSQTANMRAKQVIARERLNSHVGVEKKPQEPSEEFPFGLSAGNRPLTYTGQVVSLETWRLMTDDEKLGPS